MKPKSLSYPTILALFFSVFSFMIYATEHPRISPELHDVYLTAKILFAVLGLIFAFRFHRSGVSDVWAFGFFIVANAYVLTFMWFTPMYEAAYMEVALGCCFLRLRKPWLFPATFFAGLLGIYATYAAQDRLQWKVVPADRMDWIWIVAIFFMLSALVHKYAVSAERKERDRMARFGLIGMESSRIIHDLKGLLSSPLMIVDMLQNKGRQLQPEVFEKQMVSLAEEMEKIRDMIRSLNRLVVVDDSISAVDLLAVIQAPMKILDRRLRHVKVTLPETKLIQGNPERLQSVFFNLLINSLEAFEESKIDHPHIEMGWREKTFFFSDNGGGLKDDKVPLKSTKPGGSGLGLQLVEADLQKIGAEFTISSKDQSTTIEIQFRFA